MSTRVFYELWQMECCGEPFRTGDRIKWYVKSAACLTSDLGIMDLDYVYDAHFDDWEGVNILKGVVKKIFIYYVKYNLIEGDPHRMMVPVCEINELIEADSSHIDEMERNKLKAFGYVIELDDVTVREAKPKEEIDRVEA